MVRVWARGRSVGRGVSSTRGGSCDGAHGSFLSQETGRRSGLNDDAASAGAREKLPRGPAS